MKYFVYELAEEIGVELCDDSSLHSANYVKWVLKKGKKLGVLKEEELKSRDDKVENAEKMWGKQFGVINVDSEDVDGEEVTTICSYRIPAIVIIPEVLVQKYKSAVATAENKVGFVINTDAFYQTKKGYWVDDITKTGIGHWSEDVNNACVYRTQKEAQDEIDLAVEQGKADSNEYEVVKVDMEPGDQYIS